MLELIEIKSGVPILKIEVQKKIGEDLLRDCGVLVNLEDLDRVVQIVGALSIDDVINDRYQDQNYDKYLNIGCLILRELSTRIN